MKNKLAKLSMKAFLENLQSSFNNLIDPWHG